MASSSVMSQEAMSSALEKASKKPIKAVLAAYDDETITEGINKGGFMFKMCLDAEECNFFMSTNGTSASFKMRIAVPVETLKAITFELERRSGVDTIVSDHGGAFNQNNPVLYANILMTKTTLYINNELVTPYSVKTKRYGSGSGLIGLIMCVKKDAKGTTYFNATVKMASLDMKATAATITDEEFFEDF